MGFVLLTLGMLVVIIGVLVLISHFYQGSTADLVDWKPTRSPELEVQNEIDDVRQMLEAQNEMRRRRGVAEIDEGKLRVEVEEEELERLRRWAPGPGRLPASPGPGSRLSGAARPGTTREPPPPPSPSRLGGRRPRSSSRPC